MPPAGMLSGENHRKTEGRPPEAKSDDTAHFFITRRKSSKKQFPLLRGVQAALVDQSESMQRWDPGPTGRLPLR